MSFVAACIFYHFLAHVAIVRLIAIKIFNRSAALLIIRAYSVAHETVYVTFLPSDAL